MVDILGLSGTVRVSPVYADTQTQGVGHGGNPQIVQDGPGIPGVHGYSDTGGLVMVDILGLSSTGQV